jgi:hypothetical protein
MTGGHNLREKEKEYERIGADRILLLFWLIERALEVFINPLTTTGRFLPTPTLDKARAKSPIGKIDVSVI